jgi:hypothetical protein
MGPVRYQCSHCGYVMSEIHGTCPGCGVSLYTKQAPVQPVKPYTKISFRRDIIIGVVFMVVAIAGFLIWFPGRTGSVNDSGPIFLIGLAAVIGFASIMMAFDKKDDAAGKEPKPTVFQKYSPDQIIGFVGITISILSLGLGIVGVVERKNQFWQGTQACLAVPVLTGLIFLYAKYEAKRKKK